MNKHPDSNIFLIGMMGSGKTSVGKSLSKMLNFQLIDIDKDIEKVTDTPIREVFTSYGEKKFREMEHDSKCFYNSGRRYGKKYRWS